MTKRKLNAQEDEISTVMADLFEDFRDHLHDFAFFMQEERGADGVYALLFSLNRYATLTASYTMYAMCGAIDFEDFDKETAHAVDVFLRDQRVAAEAGIAMARDKMSALKKTEKDVADMLNKMAKKAAN